MDRSFHSSLDLSMTRMDKLDLTLLLIGIPFIACINNVCKDRDDGFYPDGSTCYGYITCTNNTVAVSQCLPGLVWNNVGKLCTLGVCRQIDKGLRNVRFKMILVRSCNISIMESRFTKSKLQCAALCMTNKDCKSFQWNISSSRCIYFENNCIISNTAFDSTATIGNVALNW